MSGEKHVVDAGFAKAHAKKTQRDSSLIKGFVVFALETPHSKCSPIWGCPERCVCCRE